MSSNSTLNYAKTRGLTTFLIIATIAGGYTIKDYPPAFLELFTNPLVQFMMYAAMLYLVYYDDADYSLKQIFIESAVIVLVIQLLKRILYKVM
jgi:hypothetical protein